MTRILKPEIQLEQALAGQIYHALEGDVVRFVLKNAQGGTDDDYWRSRMEGHCMKADKNLLGNFYTLCHEVQERLNFQEKVDYYVTGDSSINAFSIAAEDSEHPHIVNVNSELFNLMSEDELKFVIGHELGHLINQDTALRRLIHFVYPPESTQIPITLQYKIHLHDNLAELVADRYGYIACGNLEACVTAFFKMASGLDLEKMQVSIDDLLSDNSKHLDYFLKGGGMSHYDHPVNPIRVQAINLFASARNQIELDNGMEELIQILLKVGNNPLDEPMSVFVATAGIIAANVDGNVSKEEYEQIIGTLSGSNIFPKSFLESVLKEDVDALFEKSVSTILSINPGLKPSLLEYMIGIILSDREIGEKEVNFIYGIGKSLGLSVKEISVLFAGMVQRNFNPSLDAIS
ncbi:MAG: M48 family metallopeptidase [Candidatus Cryptobacteroides sp.]|nr:M48 family metallopeptidase [Candidatus Cryptobacteroides sp.]MEE3466356.1 M48 family metallopeptidase [Candidatus Cryptobacteroides sp.]